MTARRCSPETPRTCPAGGNPRRHVSDLTCRIFAADAEAGAGSGVAAGGDGAHPQDGLGSGQAPAGAGDAHAVADEVAAGARSKGEQQNPPPAPPETTQRNHANTAFAVGPAQESDFDYPLRLAPDREALGAITGKAAVQHSALCQAGIRGPRQCATLAPGARRPAYHAPGDI